MAERKIGKTGKCYTTTPEKDVSLALYSYFYIYGIFHVYRNLSPGELQPNVRGAEGNLVCCLCG